ncbi:MAG: hypothetical protein KME18_06060 [Phormidium tanganyikae FI6-MK23]|jgi:hypothetical protein|nr:hypothetical protein [Phormidium tanganyikae FI6-MK23]
MTQEEALECVAKALAPTLLRSLQIDVFRGDWNKHFYHKIAGRLNHEYSYIKDVGAELWQLFSKALGVQVTFLIFLDRLSPPQL